MTNHDTHIPAAAVPGPRIERLIAVILIVAFALAAIGYSLGPIFEGPDEFDHYQYIRTVADSRALPNALEQTGRQYHQSPLYYMLVSPIAALVPDPDFGQFQDRFNPFRGYLFNIAGNDNKNVFLHSRSEQFPYTDNSTALAVHLIRLISVVFGVGTMLTSYAIFHLLWPDRPDRRLLALAMIALWPQFAYMSGVVTNDSLLFLLTTVSLWLLLRQLRDGPSWRGAIVLGVVLGAALLTKISAIFLAFPVGLAFALDRRAWRFVLPVLGIVVLMCGWWFVRNTQLYGDPTGARALFDLTQPGEAVGSGELVPEAAMAHLPFAYQTFWARFGDGRVPVGEQLYSVFAVITAVGLSGVVVWLICRARRWRERDALAVRQAFVVAAFVSAWLILLVYYASRAVNGAQGRYLLSGVAGWGAVWSIGLGVWAPGRARRFSVLAVTGLMGIIAAASLFGYFLPTYRPTAAPTQIEHPLSLRYGDAAELIGIEPELTRARPGQMIRVKLIWRAIEPVDVSLQTYLHTQGSEIIRRDSFPATGNLLSTDWLPGQTWTEDYLIVIPEDAEEQAAYPLVAGLYDPETGAALPAIDAGGSEVTPTIGRIAVSGPSQSFTPVYRFGEIIGLAEPRIAQEGNHIDVCLKWLSIAPASADYQVFVHLLDADGNQIAQADLQPRGGRYPTSVWLPGEAIDDCVALDAPGLPPSGWQIAVGLYDLATSQRPPAMDAGGRVLENNRVIIGP
ncbi:MAG: glycosyltransferase family 39 protein [Anaerolineae bacterium]|nr:glycosyltransferase family 39 protein [Anaerolineae bacterium]